MRQLKKKGEHNWMPPKHAELLQQLRRKLPPTHTAGPAETLLGAHNAWVMSRAKLQLAGALGENGQRCKCWKPVLRATQVLWWSVVSQGSAIWDRPCSVTGWMHFPASFLPNISSAQRKKWDQPNSLNEREHDTCTKRDRQSYKQRMWENFRRKSLKNRNVTTKRGEWVWIRQREMETGVVFGGKSTGGERRGQSPRHSASSEQSPFSAALSV